MTERHAPEGAQFSREDDSRALLDLLAPEDRNKLCERIFLDKRRSSCVHMFRHFSTSPTPIIGVLWRKRALWFGAWFPNSRSAQSIRRRTPKAWKPRRPSSDAARMPARRSSATS